VKYAEGAIHIHAANSYHPACHATKHLHKSLRLRARTENHVDYNLGSQTTESFPVLMKLLAISKDVFDAA